LKDDGGTANGGTDTSVPQTFTITVMGTGNTAPVLTVPGDQVVCQLVTQQFACSATDADVPANHLTFSLVAAPGGASIDPASGLITWVPGNLQRPATVDFTVRVTDDGAPPMTDTKSFKIIVPDNCEGAPVIVQQPQGQSVPGGTNVTFTALAVGSEPLIYQWRRNGVNIPGATNTTLTITNAQAEDGGSYSMAAANDFGAVNSDPAILDVQVPPVPPGDNFANRVLLTGN
jgi:Immunoglobulin domain/Putative Ig domain